MGVCKDTRSAAATCEKKTRHLKRKHSFGKESRIPSLVFLKSSVQANMFWLFLHGCMFVM